MKPKPVTLTCTTPGWSPQKFDGTETSSLKKSQPEVASGFLFAPKQASPWSEASVSVPVLTVPVQVILPPALAFGLSVFWGGLAERAMPAAPRAAISIRAAAGALARLRGPLPRTGREITTHDWWSCQSTGPAVS